MNTGHVTYAYIGIRSSALYPQLAEKLNLPVDVRCARLERRPRRARRPGRHPRATGSKVHFQGIDFHAGGDVITAINGQKIVDSSDLPKAIAALNPGDVAHLDIIRDGKEQTVDVTLGTRPDDGSRDAAASRSRCLFCPAVLQEVALGQRSLADYTHIAGKALIERIRELAGATGGQAEFSTSARPRSAAASRRSSTRSSR